MPHTAYDWFPFFSYVSPVLTIFLAIDHLTALLADRTTLTSRLNNARAALSPGHPALSCAPNHLDEKGIPLWEREWTGGTGWNDADDDADDD